MIRQRNYNASSLVGKKQKKKKNYTLLLILMRELNKCISAVGVRFSHETAELMIWKILATVKRTFMLYV